ncbi:uncharacterized protein EAE98_012400 [Botrytis deweyae]|uniref:V-ATPase proteolipid subunit C-like domain-containing protein n=1 Tax=Botrytis deweyae TaxID=2478750 RepID=A0ABQ7I390_9HELO|nr:uncharacterized protein EAE98_012400 [Botrytis deweyae]KAF7909011.1 hypothetical protein EAE98_012400 [Botrytis deweyae]
MIDGMYSTHITTKSSSKTMLTSHSALKSRLRRCCCAIVLSNIGAAYGITKSSIGISAVIHPPISILITSTLVAPSALHTNFLHLAADLSVRLSCLASGFSSEVIGDAGVRGAAMQPKMFIGMALVLIFAEILDEPLRINHRPTHDHASNSRCYAL